MPYFSDDVTPAAMHDRLQELTKDPSILTLKYIIGEQLFIEWGHSIGILNDQALREAVSLIPPLELRSIVAAPEVEVFLWTGFVDTQNFYNLFFEYASVSETDKPRIFDFGCGCGRMSRYFDMIPRFETYASDVNKKAVEWCCANLKNVISTQNGETPPLPFEDNFFDMAYSLSIFTHLNEESVKLWLLELERVIAPGGLLILTTHGYPAISIIKDSKIHQDMFCVDKDWISLLLEQFQQRPFVFIPYSPAVIDRACIQSAYGNTFIHPDYANKNWENSSFQILKHIPGGLRGWQDVWVLRKR